MFAGNGPSLINYCVASLNIFTRRIPSKIIIMFKDTMRSFAFLDGVSKLLRIDAEEQKGINNVASDITVAVKRE